MLEYVINDILEHGFTLFRCIIYTKSHIYVVLNFFIFIKMSQF